MDLSSAAFGLPLPLPLAVGLFYIVVLLRGGGTYALGRGARSGAGRTRVKARLETPRFRRAERLVERFGAPIVAASFLTVGFQTLANLAAGVARMPLPAYLPALAVGGLAWALIWGVVGAATYEAVAMLAARSPVEATVFVVVLVGVLLTIELLNVRRARRREAAALADAADAAPAAPAVPAAAPATAELTLSAEMNLPNAHLGRNVHLDDAAPAPAETPHSTTHPAA